MVQSVTWALQGWQLDLWRAHRTGQQLGWITTWAEVTQPCSSRCCRNRYQRLVLFEPRPHRLQHPASLGRGHVISALADGFGGDGAQESQLSRRRRRRRRRPGESSFPEPFRETLARSPTVIFPCGGRQFSGSPVGGQAASSEVARPEGKEAGEDAAKASIPEATAAIARGDISQGLAIFLRCMSRRRSKPQPPTSKAGIAGATVLSYGTSGNGSNASASRGGGGGGEGKSLAIGQDGVQACNKFLRALGDAGRIDEAIVAYEAMVASGVRPTIVTFSTLISRAGACRRVRVAERFYDEMLEVGITPDVQAMNSLINAFSKAGSPDRALEAFEEMSTYGVSPSIITFNSLIDACARAGDIDRAREVFARLADTDLRPNDRTFSALIHSHARRGQVDEAFALLQDMRAWGLAPNRVTYSALINACGRAGQLSRAFQTLDEMCNSGIEPNVITWTTLIDACGKGKELEWSFRLFKEMRERGTVPNGVTCSALMDACLKANEVDLAFSVLEHMLDIGIEPTEVTYTSLLTQCARLGQADRAAVVLDRLGGKERSTVADNGAPVGSCALSDVSAAGGGERVPPGSPMEATTAMVADVSATVGGGLPEKAAVRSGRMDPKLENDLLKLFGKADQVHAAFKVLEGMVARRESPDSETWLLLLNAVGTAGELDKAVALLELSRVEGDGSEINELTYSALLGACGRAKKLERAFRIVQGMRDSGVQPTEATYLALMEVCRHSRDSKAAVQVFEAMKTEGLRPGVRSYTSLLEVISEGNTLRTRNLQRARVLENRGPRSPAISSRVRSTSVASSPSAFHRAPPEGEQDGETPRASTAQAAALGVHVNRAWDMRIGAQADALGPTVSREGEAVERRSAAMGESSPRAPSGRRRRRSTEDAAAAPPDEGADDAAAVLAFGRTERGVSLGGKVSEGRGTVVETPHARVGNLSAPSSSTPSPRQSSADGAGAVPAAAATPTPAENPALDNLFRVFLVFQEMRSRGVRPDLRAYNAIVNTCADLGEFDRALEVVRQMVDDDHGGGLQPDVVTYTSLIKAAARSYPPRVAEAEEVFATMQQRTNHFTTFVQPTEVTYAHLMKASLGAGDAQRALELWRQQLAGGIPAGARSTRVALAACSMAGDVDTALEVYRAMRSASIRPENRPLLELVNLCRANGMHDRAARILRERSSGGSCSGSTRELADEKHLPERRRRDSRSQR